MRTKLQLEVECPSCSGTGVYKGFCEPKGVGVVCLTCEGTGKGILKYIPFTVRQQRSDIKTVRRASGAFIQSDVGSGVSEISYEDFLAGKMP